MKIISDIRIFRGTIENIDNNPHPSGFANQTMNLVVKRFIMKLRESNFSFGEFDHLYINFTTCFVEDGIMQAKRSIDKYHPWYRYYDYYMDEEQFEKMISDSNYSILLDAIKKVLLKFFSNSQAQEEMIDDAIAETQKGENMLIKYKEKITSKYKATIYLRLCNDGKYHPLLEVQNNDSMVLHKDMDAIIDLGIIGDIAISGKRVVIKPKKSQRYSEIEPVVYELKV